MKFTEKEQRLIKRVRSYRIPPKSGANVSELETMIKMSYSQDGEYNLIAIAVNSFTFGFMRGQNYEKNRLSRGNLKSL